MQGRPVVRVKTQRDKQGGETILLTHGREGEGSPQVVIFAHRRLPGLAMGRQPFDEETIRLLQRRYPDLDFDWPKILRVVAANVPQTVTERPRAGRQGPGESAEPSTARQSSQGSRRGPSRSDRVQRGAADSGADEGAADESEPPAPASIPIPPRDDQSSGVLTESEGPRATPSEEPETAMTHEPPPESALPAARTEISEATGGVPGSLAERYAYLVDRIHRRVRDPHRRSELLAEAAALEPSRWPPQPGPEDTARADAIWEAVRRQLPSRRRRRRRAPGADRGPSATVPDEPTDAAESAEDEP